MVEEGYGGSSYRGLKISVISAEECLDTVYLKSCQGNSLDQNSHLCAAEYREKKKSNLKKVYFSPNLEITIFR